MSRQIPDVEEMITMARPETGRRQFAPGEHMVLVSDLDSRLVIVRGSRSSVLALLRALVGGEWIESNARAMLTRAQKEGGHVLFRVVTSGALFSVNAVIVFPNLEWSPP